jgi:hypothetical protein
VVRNAVLQNAKREGEGVGRLTGESGGSVDSLGAHSDPARLRARLDLLGELDDNLLDIGDVFHLKHSFSKSYLVRDAASSNEELV